MTQRAPKISELMPALSEMYRTNVINEFTIKRARVDADNLIKNGVLAQGHAIHALVESLLLDTQAFKYHYDIVVSRSTNSIELLNMAKCLTRLGFQIEAYNVSEHVANHNPDNIDVLDYALDASIHAAKFYSYLAYFDKLEKLGYQGFTQDDVSIQRIIKSAVPYLKEHNFLDEDSEKLVELVTETIRNKKVAFRGIGVIGGESGHLSLKYFVAADVETAVDITFDIADRIVSVAENSFHHILTFGCGSVDELHPE